MEEKIESFFDNYGSYFYEYVSDICVNLRKNNSKYHEIGNKQTEIMNNFPRLRGIIEDDISTELSKEEVSAFIEYLSLLDDKKMIEEKEIFFKGGAEAYYYFNRIGILKD